MEDIMANFGPVCEFAIRFMKAVPSMSHMQVNVPIIYFAGERSWHLEFKHEPGGGHLYSQRLLCG